MPKRKSTINVRDRLEWSHLVEELKAVGIDAFS